MKSVRKMIDIPSMTTDLMDEFMKGQSKVNLDLRVSKDLAFLFKTTCKEYCYGSVGHGTSDQFQYYLYDRYEAKLWGIPAVGSTGVYRVRLSL